MTDQARQPAGAPDGGQFAPASGEESTTVLTEARRPRAEVAAAVAHATTRMPGFNTAMHAANQAYCEATIREAASIARAICPDATRLTFEGSADSIDDPSQVALAGVACPHVPTDYPDGVQDTYYWADSHGATASDFYPADNYFTPYVFPGLSRKPNGDGDEHEVTIDDLPVVRQHPVAVVVDDDVVTAAREELSLINPDTPLGRLYTQILTNSGDQP